MSRATRSDSGAPGQCRTVPLSTDADPDLQAYLKSLREDPSFDRARRQIVERLAKAGIKLKG